MAHSTVDSGYRLRPTPLQNPVTSDAYFERVLRWYLDEKTFESVSSKLVTFGDEAISDQIHTWIANAEKDLPYVKQYDAWGQRYPYDKLVTAEGWKQLGHWGHKNG
jgi:hypothetical protein